MRNMVTSFRSGRPALNARAALTVLLLSLLMLLCLAPAAYAVEPSKTNTTKTGTTATAKTRSVTAIRMSGKKAILYNPQTGAVYTGLKKVHEIPAGSGNYFYFRKNRNGVVYNNGFFKVGKKTYYANKDGRLMTGVQRIGKFGYYFGPKGVLKTGGFIKVSSDVRYYATKNGRLRRGLRKIDGNYYYFDKESFQMQTGWLKNGSNTYFLRTGSKRKGQAVVGWLKRNGSTYYFDDKGRMVHGWITIAGKKNYFDPASGERYTGVRVIDGKTYNFGTDGITVEATGPWMIKVNQSTCTVTVYRGETPVKAFACSTGAGGATPSGTFRLLDKLRWHELMGPSWGQWCSHITPSILFHSLPYNSYCNKYSMSPTSYNQLGRAVSHGCIRLAAGDAKYLYDNCPIGTTVRIFWGSAKDDPLGKPMPAYVGYWSRNYDPTDPTI